MTPRNAPKPAARPLVAITPDVLDRNGHETLRCTTGYARCVHAAGGIPLVIPPIPGMIDDLLALVDAVVLTGGDDPRTEPFGVPTDARVTPVHGTRQGFETELLRRLEAAHPQMPVLGVCLGMQMMALVAGGALDQHMPDTTPTHAEHWEGEHEVRPEFGVVFPAGMVRSKHRQAVADPGRMRVIARAHDGVIEGIDDPARPHYVGVQWHPERTSEHAMGQRFFDELVAACLA